MSRQIILEDDYRPSILWLIVDAVAFWLRSPMLFWIVTLPIAGLAAIVTYIVAQHQSLAELHNHWGWDFLFALIYGMFLDRWIKASLLDGASSCDEVDNLRRSVISPRFLGLASALFLLALAMSASSFVALNAVIWSAAASLCALYLPALSAAAPLSLHQAFVLGRPLQIQLFLLIAGSAAVSLLAGWGFEHAAAYLPNKPWNPAAVAAARRVIDCVSLAIVGHVLAACFRERTDWQQPEPDDHPYRGLGRARAARHQSL
jgi:hypothetical protein